jgi:hypothetical protein
MSSEPTKITVITDHSEDALFGPDGPPPEYDAGELLGNLHQAIADRYPSATVNVTASQSVTSVCTDGSLHDNDIIYELIHSTWETWLAGFEQFEAE